MVNHKVDVVECCLYPHLLTHLGAKSLDLEDLVKEFKNGVINWDKYDAEINVLSVTHSRK